MEITPALLTRLMTVIEDDIIERTRAGTQAGNKIFGAALLRKDDLSLVLAETNNETESPLWHGEMHCLKRFYEMPAETRPDTKDLIFLSTHEPCSLCLSAITWAGFDNFFYFFTYEDSRDAFAIPHDLKILDEVFGLPTGNYKAENAFWKSWSIKDEIARIAPELGPQATRLAEAYDALSETYQASKDSNAIPLA